MRIPYRSGTSVSISGSVITLAALLGVLWLAGGASRPDALGQVLVRTAAWLVLTGALLMMKRPSIHDVRPVAALLLAVLGLVLLQLVPLPPGVWQSLPGRAIFERAAVLAGESQPWRPLAIVPEAAYNAAASLVVPFAILVLIIGLDEREVTWLPGMLLTFIAVATLPGLAQFAGAAFNNPLINDTPGQVSGIFANRNHYALLLALGCLVAPVWAFGNGSGAIWRMVTALGLILVFTLTILATGSRAGLLLGVLALAIGFGLTWRRIRQMLHRGPKWLFPTLIAGGVTVIVIVVLLSIAADRAVSIDRAMAMDAGQDMRRRGLPIVIEMIRIYFPIGSGLGGFDPLFRMHEPFELLKPTYFNHAHNDFLEIVLDTGMAGLVLLVAGIGWWGWASFRVWRDKENRVRLTARLGSAMIFLILLASIFDYPARTPTVMALLVLAAVWLSKGASDRARA
ncbi:MULTISPECIES: O-antigen ligase family protein [Sphingomonas]|jgi:O-antigen ligase|uniref:O-antigen ligase family protein n=1 Tax=Sphingomonas TaxID=13687 RepID=UPI0028D6C53C|nr:O-antigen ligase family protein [Sphingomonas paucimobilis]